MLLHSYRLYHDVVIQQESLSIYSSRIVVSVVDNVLLIHQVDAKVIILYDLFADSRAPISAPLPLLLRGFPRSNSTSQFSGRESESSDVNIVSSHEAVTYTDTWNFLVPDLVCDVANKLLWKFNLDLEAISASNSDVSSVLDFLQRRKLEANKAKQLCLESDAVGKSVVHESTTRVDSGTLDSEDESQFSILKHSSKEALVGGSVNNVNSPRNEAHRSYAMQSSLLSAQEDSQLTAAAISPDEIVNLGKIRVAPNLYVLIIQLLVRNEHYAELGLFIVNKILEPSKEVALQLLESGRQNTQTRKLGLDMLRQLSLHNDYVLLLVQDGYYLEAL
ncbi:hypothetical protein RYX36_034403 [Vicia faba]